MKDYSGLEIAIIGMAGRFPGAGDVHAFWNNLANGVESISFFTDEELIMEGVDKSLISDPLYVKAHGLLEDKDCFDSLFFHYRPDEARLMEPQMRIFHECVWAALEDAGWNPDDEKSKVGLFAGSATNTNWEVYAQLENRKGYVDDFSASLVANPRFLSTKIAYNLNLKGPSIYLDTACSTSLVALHQACRSLLMGECTMAVAGGVHVTGRSRTGYKYEEGMVHSRDGHCRTFDDSASGTVGGEGAGAVVLKTLKNALKDGDHIWAVIKGSGINNDGSNKVGYTAPSIHGQVEAILMAQKWAKIPVESISYIEAHGTATRLGDPVEVEALIRVFGKSAEKYCALGSVKSNIGHLDAAAGVAGVIKTVLAMKHRQIPPSLHFQTLNREIDLDDTPFYVNASLREWRNDKYPLRAGVSSFGIGGTNVHVVLEEAPPIPVAKDGMRYQILMLSAKTPAALGRLTERYCEYFSNGNEDRLADVAYTLQTGRKHHPYRKTLVCSSCSEAMDLLVSGKAIEGDEPVADRLNRRKVFMFSGQGSQYMNMCYDLYVHEPAFKEEVDRCLKIIKERTNKDLLSVLFSDDPADLQHINNTEHAQPLLFVVEYSLARLLMKWGVVPDLMIGHSIGEYVAACISGVFSLEDALWLVIRRGELMQSAPAGIMMSVSISPDKLRTMLAENRELSLAAVNSLSLCVVSGTTESIHAFKEMLAGEGIQCKVLRTSHAFHSCMMDGILDSFRNEVKRVTIHPPKIPFVSNLTGDWADAVEISTADYWADHLRQTVLFADGIQKILENDQAVLIEVGPGRSLCTMARSSQMRTKAHKVFQLVRGADEDMNDVQFLFTTLGRLWLTGAGPDWSLMHKKEVRRKLSLPGYPFEKKRYPVHVDPFRTLADEYAGDHVQKRKDVVDWLYVPCWKMVPGLSNAVTDRSGGWTLLLADNCGIGMSLALEYRRNGQNIIYVTAGESYRKKGEGMYEVCPGAKADYTMLFSDLEQQGRLPDRIVHAWGVTDSELSGFPAESLDLAFFSLVEIVMALRHYGELAGKRLVLLTSGVHRIFDEGHEAGKPSPASALLIVLSQEFQGVCTSHIDISLSDSVVADFPHKLYREVQMAKKGIVICLRHGKRWQQTFEKAGPASDSMSADHFRKGGVYLITGGLGNMGFNIAAHLVTKYSARVALLGRTQRPSPEKMKLLQQLQAQGGEVLYLAANVADVAALGDAVRKCEKEFGKLNGVIHAAGIMSGTSIRPVVELTREDFYTQFEPKALGLQALRAVTGGMDLDFCLVTSSLSAVLGGVGFGAYASANAFMDHYIDAHQSNGELRNWVSVNFDGFDLEKENNDTITCREMIAVLDEILSLKECPRVVVSAFDLQRRVDKWVLGLEMEREDKNPYHNKYQDDLPKSADVVIVDGGDPMTSTLLNLWQNFFGRQDITADDDFFDLGGDSLKALTMTGRIYKVVNIEIPIEEFFNRSSVNRLAEFIQAKKVAGKSHMKFQAIQKSRVQEGYPLSSTQRRLYFLYEFDKSSTAYNLPKVIHIKGVVEIERFHQIIQIIARRHEILRTYVGIDGEVHVQRIAEDIDIPIEHFHATAERVPLVVQEFVRPFDLTKGPLIRVGLIEVAEEDYVFVIDMHHFISDGVSLNIFLKEFAALYKGEELDEQPLQYRDYAVWQSSEINQQAVARERSWWLQEFNEEVMLLDLPLDYKRPVVLNNAGNTVDFVLNEQEMGGLRKIADAEGATTFMVLLSIYSILLGKLTGQEDVVIGTPTSGRNHADLETIMGMFTNTLAIRTRPNGTLGYREFLKQLKSKILTVFDQQAYPYELLIKDLKVDRDSSRNPLFDVFFSYDNQLIETFELPGLNMSPFHTKSTVSMFDLSLNASEGNGNVHLSFEYSTELFTQGTIERFTGYFQQVVSAVILDPNVAISSIDILSSEERRLLTDVFNDTRSIYPTEETIVSLFENQAKLEPDKIAVVYESQRLTYRQLDERSSQLAYCLREQYQVDREQVVGIMMERSEKMMIGILGILKAGGAYLPIDPVYPKERVEYILKDSGACVLMVDRLPGNHLQYAGMVLSVDAAISENKRDNDLSIHRINTSGDLCYLIYTSGSTGRPKGVMISHYNVVNFFYAMHRRLSVSHEDSMLAVTSTAFDISVLELLWTLCSGIEVVIHPSDISLLNLDRYLGGENGSFDFSLFFFSSYSNTENNKYNLLLESVKYADREGFKAVWTPERHFHEFGGLYPNPAVLSSALAMITGKIELRSGSVVSPLHDALRIAEEWSVVDNLSNGRVGLSFASGWNPNDFALARGSYNDRHKTMYEQIEEVKKLWKGECIHRKNGVGQEVQLRIFPEPVQKELPVWITSGGSEETFKSAGAIGANVLTHLLGQDIEDLERKIKIYRSSRAQHGYNGSDGKVTIMLHTYIGEDIDEVEKLAEGPFMEYLRSSIGLMKIMFEESGLREEDISEELKEKILKNAFRRYYETSSLIGTKSSCEKLILKLKRIGVDEIACLVDFGIEESKVLEGLNNLNTLKNLHVSHPAMVHKPVTLMQSTPSFIKSAMESEGSRKLLSSLRVLLVGGEPVPSSLVRELTHITNAGIYNMYGPTETTIWSCMHRFSRNEERVSVGAPILNTQIYILDKDYHLLPIGVAGEVYIGGAGVSRGYWKRPDLTMERFIKSPFVEGEKIYKTGDLGRWLWDGNIELIGREDQQVKIRGYRIELGEIESRLLTFPKIKEAAVIVKQGKEEGDKTLVAYIVAEGAVDIPALRRHLGNSLPNYMLPGFVVELRQLPLSPNGKLDRKALPDPEIRITDDYAAPQTKEERLLAEVWSKVLGVEKVSITDNFFSIGGDSIKSIQIISRMRTAGYEVSVKDILISQTIKQLAFRLREVVSIADQSAVTGVSALTPVQQLFFEGPVNKKHHYNQSIMLNFSSGIRADLVKDIFAGIWEHHDALRMVFKLQPNGTRVMENRPVGAEIALREYDLRSEPEALSVLLSYCNEIQAGGDLETGPLMRLGLFHMKDGSRLLIVIHHLIVDGISWRILFEDIEALYLQFTRHEPLHLPHKTHAFIAWPAHLAAYIKSKAYEKAVRFWVSQSNKVICPIPRDFEEGEGKIRYNRTETFRLSPHTTAGLLTQSHRRFGTRINDLLLTALLLTVRQHYGISAVQVDMEGHGREEIATGFDFSRTVGWFTSVYPVVLEVNKDGLSALIKEVKETLRRIPNNGIDYGIRRYLDRSGPEQGNAGPSRIMFNYLGQFDTDLQGNTYAIALEMRGDELDLEEISEYDWEISGLVISGELEMRLHCSERQYKPETIRCLMDVYKQNLEQVIACCIADGKREFTPSDLTYKSLPAEWLDELQDRYALEDVYPLSPMQEGMLFHSLLDEKGGEYFAQTTCLIRGPLEIRAVEQSMNDIIARHVALRTAFIDEYDRPLQIVLQERKIDFLFSDCRSECESDGSGSVISRFRDHDRSRKFDLGKDVLMRLTVLRLAEEEYEFIWSYHHVLMDGWCIGFIMNEFRVLYLAYTAGRPISLPVAKPYSGYISWLETRNRAESADYWRRYLAGYEHPATMAHFVKTPRVTEIGLANERLVISRSLTNLVQNLCVQYGVTTNTILQTAWGILLSKYNNTHDVVFGSVVSVRPSEIDGIEAMVGLFINTIPVRVTWNEKDKVSDVLRNMQEIALDAEPYQYHPLSEIQTFSSLGRNLMDHILVFENYPLSTVSQDEGDSTMKLSITGLESVIQTNYDLALMIVPGEEICIHFTYFTHIYEKRYVQRMACHLDSILRQMVMEDDMAVAGIEIVTDAEKRELAQFHGKVILPPERSFIQQFKEQVMQTDHTEIFILDKHQNLLPVGIPGELCVGGANGGGGYHGRIYRTGDLARWLPDGAVEFLGRIDHQVEIRPFSAIPEPGMTAVNRYIAAPQTKEEGLLVEAWSQLLGRKKEQIGVDDDFFELGGHSFVAIRLIYLIRQRFTVELAMRQIFENPSIKKLARLITSAKRHRTRSIQKVEKREYYPVSSAQERLFFEHMLNKDIPVYNTCIAFKIEGKLDTDKLTSSFQSLIIRHECLRTGFMLITGGIVQVVSDAMEFELINLNESKYATVKEAFEDFVQPFDLSARSLMRCGLLRSRKEGNILFVDIHHIVCDGVSKNILMNDFKSIYNGTETEPIELRYIDYAYWQLNQNGRLHEQKEFWIRSLGDRTVKADLPVVRQTGAAELHYAAYEVFQPGDELVAGIKELVKTSEASVFMILLSVYYLLLSKVSGSADIVIGTEGIGRTHGQLKNVVGSFVNILPMRMQVRTDLAFTEFLAEVKECVLQAFENQDFQYDQIVTALREVNESYDSLIDAHFSFANLRYSTVELGELRFIPIDGLWTETTEYELSLQVTEEENRLCLYFVYSTGYFNKETILQLMDYYRNILSDALKQALCVEYAGL